MSFSLSTIDFQAFAGQLQKDKLLALLLFFSASASAAEAFYFNAPVFFKTLVVVSTAFMPFVLYVFYKDYQIEKRQAEIEAALPSALFQIASFPSGSPFERMLESIGKSDFGPLGKEFAFALRQVRAGHSLREALLQIKQRNSSPLLHKACGLLLKAYASGSDASGMFKQIAEDVYSLQEISRETAASLALQKYTLLAGGSILVPLVLASLYNISSSLSQDFAGNLLDLPSNPGLQETVFWANQLYLGVFALVAGVFIARMESKPGKAVLYFAFMAVVSLILFNLLQGAIVI
ncbi:TPA: type II secretion system F family protein [Candidatus Micrarchaeota archaeon]|nr:type II secretion system F family protein [Candidatus Micrarchaeota archaeon]